MIPGSATGVASGQPWSEHDRAVAVREDALDDPAPEHLRRHARPVARVHVPAHVHVARIGEPPHDPQSSEPGPERAAEPRARG